jgi:phage major head subunit gpT-like protein
MPALTPTFVMDLESRMRKITENEYLRLTASEHMWWQKITRVIPSGARREIITWILNTAQLQDQGLGGNIAFDDMHILETEYVAKTAGKGLKLRRQQFEDLDGNGVQLASEWSAQMGAQHGYWPQKSIATLLKNGETTIAYDKKNYFATDHPNNPNDTSAGTYSNLLTGVDISTAVTVDTALANLASVYNSIASLKMPNGSDPRYLRPAGILVPPKMFPRAVQLTNAKFIAQTAGSGAAQGGSADVAALIASMGFGMPTQVDELIGFQSDTTYFVYAEQIAGSQLGAFAYVDREPFTIRYYTGRGGGNGVDAILDRADSLEWHTSGRNVAAPGHPFMLFECKP